jgi:hypothetical protein
MIKLGGITMDVSDKNSGNLDPDPRNDDLSTRKHRQLTGVIGMLLPVLLWLIAGWRPTGEHPWTPLVSISAYYYSGAVSVFAGMLVALAFFLFAYRGYGNQYYRRDRFAANLAGVAAVLVALFPTGAPGDLLILSWWTPRTGSIYLISAAVLFGCFIFFCLFQFPKSSVQNTNDLPWDKKLRNMIYIFCGVAIILCMVWVIYALFVGGSIFLAEALALEFFALSWLVKGRVDKTVADAGRTSVYYARHPHKLVKKVRDASNSK